MKKIQFSIALSLLSFCLCAQTKFGVRAGINLANVNISGSSASVSTGVNAGIFVNIHLASIVSIQPELAYSTMGFKSTVAINGFSSSGNNISNYLTLPVLVRVKLPLIGLAIYAGPQYGILLTDKATVSGVTQDVKSEYKSGDFAAVGGIEYSLPFGLFITGRYQAGISNVSNDATFTQKNKAFTILVGFKF